MPPHHKGYPDAKSCVDKKAARLAVAFHIPAYAASAARVLALRRSVNSSTPYALMLLLPTDINLIINQGSRVNRQSYLGF